MSRIDKHTERFEMKEIHGQLIQVRILKPYKPDETVSKRGNRHSKKKRYCRWCDTEVFDAGRECDLCGREF